MNLKHAIVTGLTGLLLGGMVGCMETEPDTLVGEYILAGSVMSGPSDLATAWDRAALESSIIERINAAEVAISFAISDFESEQVAAALVDAVNRGVDVRLVGDEDRQGQSGFVYLAANMPDYESRVQYGDGALSYSPEPNLELTRDADMNRMTHNFLVVDHTHVLSLSGGLVGSGDTYQFGFELDSRIMAEDFTSEFDTMFGFDGNGTFANTLDTFGGTHKSDTNGRILYMTSDGIYGLYFGPQERLMKRVIDAVYGAQSSVQIVGGEFTNTFLRDALRYKAAAEFQVSVVLDEAYLDNEYALGRELAQILTDEREGTDRDTLRVRTHPNIEATVVVIDALPDRFGVFHESRAFVLTEPLSAAIPTVTRGDGTQASRLADAFMDAHMFEVRESSQVDLTPTALEAAQEFFDHLYATGADL